MSGRYGGPFAPVERPHYDDGRTERQAAAEFNEAMGQLATAAGIWGGGMSPPQVQFRPRNQLDPTSRELAAHKIREAITNLQDVVRFMELP